jgi:DNA-binding response OmpR family regulator
LGRARRDGKLYAASRLGPTFASAPSSRVFVAISSAAEVRAKRNLYEIFTYALSECSPQRHLLREIWGPSYVESSHYLRVQVGHLRQKLLIDPTQPRHFLTETGVGYRFQP